jgi:hypothetical protein
MLEALVAFLASQLRLTCERVDLSSFFAAQLASFIEKFAMSYQFSHLKVFLLLTSLLL